jgi:hypothetical protein
VLAWDAGTNNAHSTYSLDPLPVSDCQVQYCKLYCIVSPYRPTSLGPCTGCAAQPACSQRWQHRVPHDVGDIVLLPSEQLELVGGLACSSGKDPRQSTYGANLLVLDDNFTDSARPECRGSSPTNMSKPLPVMMPIFSAVCRQVSTCMRLACISHERRSARPAV